MYTAHLVRDKLVTLPIFHLGVAEVGLSSAAIPFQTGAQTAFLLKYFSGNLPLMVAELYQYQHFRSNSEVHRADNCPIFAARREGRNVHCQ